MAAGVPSLVDYAFYPIGVPAIAVQAGYAGILDWTGIPCGVPARVASTAQQGTGGHRMPRRRMVPLSPEVDDLAAVIAALDKLGLFE